MKQIPTTQAVGHVLCHDITRIVKDECKGVAFAKGHIVRQEDIPALLALGKDHLYVWEKQPGMLHENEAAERLYALCAGAHVAPTGIKEGKISCIAQTDGVLMIDVEKLHAINAIGEIIIATQHSGFMVKKGEQLAAMRVIPLVIDAKKIERAEAIAQGQPLLSVHPVHAKRAAVITTGNEVYHGRIQDTFTPVIMEKLAEYGTVVQEHHILPDDRARITAAIEKSMENGAELVLCTGGMSVDPDDVTPSAIRDTGAELVTYGAPVLPGAMFLLAYAKHNGRTVPLLGLPGCVMYARRTVFDLMLPRVLADVPISQADIAGMGHGGLCLDCPDCTFPHCGFGKGR